MRSGPKTVKKWVQVAVLGADPDELDRLAGALRAAERRIADSMRSIDRMLSATWWSGPAAAQFKLSWSAHVGPMLRESRTKLSMAAERIAAEANAQRASSAEEVPGFRDPDSFGRLVPSPGPARSILLRDTAGDGRAIEVFGDLRTAQRIGIWVPGVGTTLADFKDPHRLAANRIWNDTPGLAMVEWLGYDPPDTIAAASVDLGRSSLEAARALNSFIESLRVGLPGGEDRVIVLGGHSYGSVVAAKAAQMGTPADQLLLVGSPGVAASSVSEFALDGSPGNRANVHVVTNSLDPVRLGSLADELLSTVLLSPVAGLSTVLLSPVAGLVAPWVLPVIMAGSGPTWWSQMAHGPSNSRFGAARLPSDSPSLFDPALSRVHQYTDPGSVSLEQIRRVYAGSLRVPSQKSVLDRNPDSTSARPSITLY